MGHRWPSRFECRARGIAALALSVASTSCAPHDEVRVTTTADSGDGSLRAAIQAANARPESTRIELDAGTYDLTRCGSDDGNVEGDLDLTTGALVELVARTPEVVIRQTCPGERVLDSHHAAGQLRLTAITLTGGSVVGENPGEGADGGGVRAAGGVALDRATIRGNSVTGGRGMSAPAGGTALHAGAARGGGVFVGGSFSAVDSVLSDNVATGGAGRAPSLPDGVEAASGAAEGGGAYVAGAAAIAGGSITDNATGFTRSRGGGLAGDPSGAFAVTLTRVTLSGNRSADGGAVAAHTVHARAIVATDNLANGNGGALYATGSVTLEDSELSGNFAHSGGAVAAWVLNADHVVAHGNRVRLEGGALLALQVGKVHASNIHDNVAEMGGGIAGADLTLSDTRVTGNLARADTSLWPFEIPRYANLGGAGVSAKTLHAERVTIAGNTLAQCHQVVVEPLGGGWSQGAGIRGGSVTLVNSTISGNRGPGHCSGHPSFPPEGIGVYATRLTLDHVTLIDNHVGPGSTSATIATAELASHASVAVSPSMLCTDLTRSPNDPLRSGLAITDSAYNWFGEGDVTGFRARCELSGPGDVVGAPAPVLGPLAENGGAVSTHLPLVGSALIDTVPPAACPVTVDARNAARPQGAACDIGAVELEPL